MVLSWNTLGDAPGAETIAGLALEVDADVVALPETSHEAGEQVRALLAASGHEMQLIDLQADQISKARRALPVRRPISSVTRMCSPRRSVCASARKPAAAIM